MKTTRWVIPEAPEPVSLETPDKRGTEAAERQRRIRIGLLDNTKDNAHLLLQLIGDRVRAEMGAELLYRRKGNATVGAAVGLLDELAHEADCVLTAMAD